jgi:MYXO-CTERM domain-containing protein
MIRSLAPAAGGLVLAAVLAGLPAHASPLVFGFEGTGAVTPGPGFDPAAPIWPLEVLAASTSYTLAGSPGWTMQSSFLFSFITSSGEGTFTLANAAGDSLFGDIDTVQDASNGPLGGFDLTYTVLGGTGGFAGFTGSGLSEVALTSDPRTLPTTFFERGTIFQSVVSTPPALPLSLLALAALAATRRRCGHC